MVGVLCVAGPLLGHAHAAGERRVPVHHQQLAVGAVVHARQVVPVQRAVALHLRASVLHGLDQVLVHLDAAHPVEQHGHLHARLGALGQRFRQFLADVARPVDVGFEGDGFLGRANAFKHGREDFIAVLQILDAVAADDGGAEHHAHLAPVLRVADGVVVLDLAVELFFGRGEIHRQHHGQHGHEDGDGDGPQHLLFSRGHGPGWMGRGWAEAVASSLGRGLRPRRRTVAQRGARVNIARAGRSCLPPGATGCRRLWPDPAP